jgi:ornithine carbamoyltransferase
MAMASAAVLRRSNGITASVRMMSTAVMKHKHFMCISQLTNAELNNVIDHSIAIKKSFKSNPAAARAALPLKGFSMSMIFQKRSTRTRVSTETGKSLTLSCLRVTI